MLDQSRDRDPRKLAANFDGDASTVLVASTRISRIQVRRRMSVLLWCNKRPNRLTDQSSPGPGSASDVESRSAQALATFCSPEALKWQSSYRSKSSSKASELTPLLRLAPGSRSAS